MVPCLYCESAAGDLPQAVVWADGGVMALLDWRQAAPGHVLVLPREHLSAEEVFTRPVGADLLAVTVRVASAVRDAFGLEAVQMGGILYPGAGGPLRASGRLREADPAAVETAEDGHFHLHILPRRHGADVARIYPFGDGITSLPRLEEMACRIRAVMEAPGARGIL